MVIMVANISYGKSIMSQLPKPFLRCLAGALKPFFCAIEHERGVVGPEGFLEGRSSCTSLHVLDEAWSACRIHISEKHWDVVEIRSHSHVCDGKIIVDQPILFRQNRLQNVQGLSWLVQLRSTHSFAEAETVQFSVRPNYPLLTINTEIALG